MSLTIDGLTTKERMTTIQITVRPAPETPLNLQFATTYAPRAITPPYVAYAAAEVLPNDFEIWAYESDGNGAILWRGNTATETFYRLCAHLRMDLPTSR